MPKKTALEAIVVRFFQEADLHTAISVLEIVKDLVKRRSPQIKPVYRAKTRSTDVGQGGSTS